MGLDIIILAYTKMLGMTGKPD